MFRVTKRRMTAVSLFAAGALLTGACSADVGAAAVVDGQRIEVATVQDAMIDLASISQGLTQADLLGVLVLEPAWTAVGAEFGVGFTDQEVIAYLDEIVAQSGLEPMEFSPGAIDLLRTELINQTLGNSPVAQEAYAKVSERLQNSEIETNPRFGDFSLENGLVPSVPSWIVDSPVNP